MVSDGSGPASTGPAATADWAFEVGKAFASQYYTVMHTQPHDVHKFYVDESKFTRAERLGIPGETVTTMQGIHSKVMSLDSCEVKAEIKSVDCQESLSGGVLVVVTGSHCYTSTSGGPGERRGFVQSFFLAPQQNGFYVLNDIFRFLEDAPPPQPPAVVKHAVGGGTKSAAASAPGAASSAAPGSGAQGGLVNGHAEGQAGGSREVSTVDHTVRDVTVDEASQASASHASSGQASASAAAPSAAAGGAGAPPAAEDAAGGDEVQVIREVPESVVAVQQGQGQGQGAGAAAGAAAAAATEEEKAEVPVVYSAPASAPAVLPTPVGGDAVAAPQAPGAAAPVPAAAPPVAAPTAAAAAAAPAAAVVPAAAVAPAAAATPAVAAQAAAPVSDEPAPKKSYASILQAMRAQSAAASPAAAPAGPSSAPPSATPPAAAAPGAVAPRQPPLLPSAGAGGVGGFVGQEAAPSAAAGFSAGLLAPAPGYAAAEDANAADEAAGEGRAVFVRNLPVRITAKEIAEHFSQFGAVKSDRIQIRGNKANNPATVYAFVEFEEAAAAQLAVEKQSIMVGNFQVKIEEKKATSTGRGSYRRTGGGRSGSDRQFRDGSGNLSGVVGGAGVGGVSVGVVGGAGAGGVGAVGVVSSRGGRGGSGFTSRVQQPQQQGQGQWQGVQGQGVQGQGFQGQGLQGQGFQQVQGGGEGQLRGGEGVSGTGQGGWSSSGGGRGRRGGQQRTGGRGGGAGGGVAVVAPS
ncbi:hypothetical protein CLOM_g24252 [Closterium sp. NIES-68]|nr:hypothetical protein CLOM_g24252 [Closterium sp. NIES-68]GJP85542.1 hypothetical protein CLOP_g15626 [Closterium sp. NIES-67]